MTKRWSLILEQLHDCLEKPCNSSSQHTRRIKREIPRALLLIQCMYTIMELFVKLIMAPPFSSI